MAQLVAKYAAKKMLAGEMSKYADKAAAGPYDPYYEEIPHPRKPGKMKKVKKQIPAYIPEQEANVLARARKTAYRMDFALFSFMGMRFGWSSVIGLVPAIGDAADALLALKLIMSMRKVACGLPNGVLFMMMFNLALDFVVGIVPFIGDLADAAFKCNGKNVRLLEEHLDKVYMPDELKAKNSKLPRESRPRPASVYVDFSEEEDERRGVYDGHHDHVRQPQRAYSGRRDRIPDEEMGHPSRNNTKQSRR